ncbi:hypothetical protein ONZ43_g2398 [Nemania bipapillata]|uniref:Uncharacterized protein n=1 Tax=Nemania bipapillata TaxID=110536 RepID=A0ACC2J0R7_9PEZI|nr:hypothetical protein ONZ43_g2398 [Nemania bipapillata]
MMHLLTEYHPQPIILAPTPAVVALAQSLTSIYAQCPDIHLLEWSNTADLSEAFQLSISAWNATPYEYYSGPFGVQLPAYDTVEMDLDEVHYSDGVYTWKVQTLNGDDSWTGDGFFYRFTAVYPDGAYAAESPRAFHIRK